jgi:serine protease Do
MRQPLTSTLRKGSVQTILLVLILLVLGGLMGGALVYWAASRNLAGGHTKTQIIYPPGTTVPTFAPVVDVIKPAVVNVYTEQKLKGPMGPFNPDESGQGGAFNFDMFNFFFGRPRPDFTVTNLGSGVIVDEKGYVLTNNHVVEKADIINIKLQDGNEYKATLVGRDPKTDLALLKINSKNTFPVAVLGDSEDIKVGDWVLAIGNPYGYSESVTHGIISALGRHVGVTEYEDFIQTDAAINPGNSGGPLVNLKGEVIGINTVIATKTGSNIGIGFAIPSNLAKTVFSELKTKGKVVRGWLGVGLQELSPDLAQKFGVSNGVRITMVIKGSPAQKAGIMVDDIITEFNGKKIVRSEQLRQMVSSSKIKQSVKVIIIRNKKPVNMAVTIGEMPEDTSQLSGIQEVNLGINVQSVTPQIAKRLRFDKVTGVLVSEVEAGSVSESSGVQAGDIILEINDIGISNLQTYEKVTSRLKKGDKIYLRIFRDGYIIYISFIAE